MKSPPITRQKIDELLRFLPVFQEPGVKFVVEWAGGETTDDGAMTMHYPVYTEVVEEFFSLAGQSCWCDYDYIPKEAREMIEDKDFIQRATLEEIKTMLTFCVRGERFCDGHWGVMLETGKISRILERLAVLRESL
jgi:hypothetical protein